MKSHEYLIIAAVSVLSVYIVNHYLITNFTVNKVAGTASPSGNVLA
jgi:hypothetical protein